MSNKRKLGEGAAVVALAATLAATACDGKGSEIDRQREECFADHVTTEQLGDEIGPRIITLYRTLGQAVPVLEEEGRTRVDYAQVYSDIEALKNADIQLGDYEQSLVDAILGAYDADGCTAEHEREL